MRSQFDRLDTGVVGAGSDREPVGGETLDKCRRHSEIAPVKPDERCAPAERVHACSWNGPHGPLLPDQTARQPIDHERRVGRRRFGVAGIGEARHVPRKLNNRVLKAGACAKKRLP